MADNTRDGKGYPVKEDPESQYPRSPTRNSQNGGDDERRPQQYQLPPVSQGPLPSMQYPPPPGSGQGYTPQDHRYQQERHQHREYRYEDQQRYPDAPGHRYADQPRPHDPQRSWSSESPTSQNGHAAPPDRYPPLPPVVERPPYDNQRQRYGEPRYPAPAPYDSYYPSQGAPPGAPGGIPQPPPGHEWYNRGFPMYHAYHPVPPPPPQPQQAAPRQRTSIACRYCRKRKIRCSGYANTSTNGKCTNCDKLRIECIFQPVSSNSSTAFVPVQAVPGGVPPGTPLYGAYGQPLQQSQPLPPRPYSTEYPPSLHSPTYGGYDERDGMRRRARPPEEDGHGLRLPPPNYPVDDDPRRRSPASNNSGTPPTAYSYQHAGGYEQDRTPTPHRHSPTSQRVLAPAPPATMQQPSPPTQQPSQPSSAGGSNPMSLNNLVGPDTQNHTPSNGIDKNMLDRLNQNQGRR